MDPLEELQKTFEEGTYPAPDRFLVLGLLAIAQEIKKLRLAVDRGYEGR